MTKEQKANINATLKACPFCGGKAKIEPCSRGFYNGVSTKVAYVRCTTCDCRTGKYDIHGERFTPAEARRLAINAWNYRFNEDASDENV